MRVVISGAGIAGLSLALRLHQRGLNPIVIERSSQLRAGGYMLGLSDPGYDAAERMGIAEALRAAQYLPQRLVYVASDGQRKFALQGRALDIPVGERQLNMMRGDIERILHDRAGDDVEIRFGRSITGLDETPAGLHVKLDGGESLDADLVVGADGLHSKVRALAFGTEDRFVHSLGARVAAFILDRSLVPGIGPNETFSFTEIGRAAGIAAITNDRLVAFFMHTAEPGRFDTIEAELRHAFAGADWRIPELLDLLPQADSVYADDVALVKAPRWSEGRVVLLGDAGYAVSLIAGKGATLAMAGAFVLADALADARGDPSAALADYEARIRPWAEQAQAAASRNMGLFTPRNRFQLGLRDTALRFASLPLFARILKLALNREGERL